jgi:hypothetical protein
MALGTVTKVKATVFGDMRVTIVDVNPSAGANYTTGGEVFGAAQVPGATGTIFGVSVIGSPIDATNKTFLVWNPATGKLVAYNQTVGTDVGLIEAASNSDLSGAAEKQRLMVFSK